MPEMPRHRQRGTRQKRHSPKFPVSERSPANSVDHALDNRSSKNNPRHSHAIRPIQARRRSLGLHRPSPSSTATLHRRSSRPASPLHVQPNAARESFISRKNAIKRQSIRQRRELGFGDCLVRARFQPCRQRKNNPRLYRLRKKAKMASSRASEGSLLG